MRKQGSIGLRALPMSVATAAALLFWLTISTVASAQGATSALVIEGRYFPVDQGPLVAPVAVQQAENQSGPQIENGQQIAVADLQYWRGIRQLKSATQKEGYCTISFVGPQTFITAAHCLVAPLNVAVEGSGPQESLKIKYCRHIERAVDAKFNILVHDVALCLLEASVTGIRYESVDLSDDLPEKILLAGYGCLAFNALMTSGALRLAPADAVRDLSQGEPPIPQLLGLNAGARVVTGMGRLCPGDSGGPAFAEGCLQQGGVSRLVKCTTRSIVGINSSRATVAGTNLVLPFSFVAPLATAEFRALLTQWFEDIAKFDGADSRICGINLSGSQCRSR